MDTPCGAEGMIRAHCEAVVCVCVCVCVCECVCVCVGGWVGVCGVCTNMLTHKVCVYEMVFKR